MNKSRKKKLYDLDAVSVINVMEQETLINDNSRQQGSEDIPGSVKVSDIKSVVIEQLTKKKLNDVSDKKIRKKKCTGDVNS
ncbi:unnamed protein product [Parnassius apollo]|uniref:(apollo) hypothetical protein n=1 Tax=Parnassius apollo TaxID=110799 RepID=A0A8S3WPG2_PARAO|nr:unnamed protein product [Parnassius apollo]